jgi:NitT/TauT family transport system substrate-binding protein
MPIRLAENFRAVFYAPFYAAQVLGLYASEGVDLELVSSSVPGDGVSALLNNTIDITWGGPMRVMKAHDLQPSSPLVCFCEVVARDPFFLVGRHRPSEFQLRDLASLRFAAVSEVPTLDVPSARPA